MKQEEKKFRLRLNLFDSIVLVLALGVGAFFAWQALAPTPDGGGETSSAQTLQYTIRLKEVLAGTGPLMQPGDELVDAVKNFPLGQIVSATTLPATRPVLEEATATVRDALVPGKEDVDVVVTAPATATDAQLLVGGGYEVRVGTQIFVKGPGYMGSGYVIAIERGA